MTLACLVLLPRPASYAGIPISKAEVASFVDGETSVKLLESVENDHVFIVQSTTPPVNENLMELLLMIRWRLRASTRDCGSLTRSPHTILCQPLLRFHVSAIV